MMKASQQYIRYLHLQMIQHLTSAQYGNIVGNTDLSSQSHMKGSMLNKVVKENVLEKACQNLHHYQALIACKNPIAYFINPPQPPVKLKAI